MPAAGTHWHPICTKKPGENAELLLEKKPLKPNESMSALAMKGNWHILKGRLKQKWARLKKDERCFNEGKEEELIGRIQKLSARTR